MTMLSMQWESRGQRAKFLGKAGICIQLVDYERKQHVLWDSVQ